jgi:hypothetical protein
MTVVEFLAEAAGLGPARLVEWHDEDCDGVSLVYGSGLDHPDALSRLAATAGWALDDWEMCLFDEHGRRVEVWPVDWLFHIRKVASPSNRAGLVWCNLAEAAVEVDALRNSQS